MRYPVIILLTVALAKTMSPTMSASVDDKITRLKQDHLRILENRDSEARKLFEAGDISPKKMVLFQMETLELKHEYKLLNGESKQLISNMLGDIDRILELEELNKRRPVTPIKLGQRDSSEWNDEAKFRYTAMKKRLEIMQLTIESGDRTKR